MLVLWQFCVLVVILVIVVFVFMTFWRFICYSYSARLWYFGVRLFIDVVFDFITLWSICIVRFITFWRFICFSFIVRFMTIWRFICINVVAMFFWWHFSVLIIIGRFGVVFVTETIAEIYLRHHNLLTTGFLNVMRYRKLLKFVNLW